MSKPFQVGDIVDVYFSRTSVHSGLQNTELEPGRTLIESVVECELIYMPQDTGDCFVLKKVSDGSIHMLNPVCSEFAGMTRVSREPEGTDPVEAQLRSEREDHEREERE